MQPILLLTPLKAEHEALCAALGASSGQQQVSGFKIRSYLDGRLLTAIGGHGKVQFALATAYLIERLQPALVICAGTAGALSPSVSQLDVVVAENTVEHDFNLRFIKRPLPRFPGDPESLKKLCDLRASFNVHFGDIASGDEDITEPARARMLFEQTGALAVAWEGAGGGRACKFHGVPFLEIRTVSDGADENTVQDFTANLSKGMENIAMVSQALLN